MQNSLNARLLNPQLRRGRNRLKYKELLILQPPLNLQLPRDRNYLKVLEDPYKDLWGLANKSGKNHNSNRSDLATAIDMEA